MSDFSEQAAAVARIAALADEALVELDAFAHDRLNGFGLFADPTAQRARLAKVARSAAASAEQVAKLAT